MAELTIAYIIQTLREAEGKGATEVFQVSGQFAGRLASVLEDHVSKLDALQAKLDRVMLEHCPDEMSEEQKEEWAKHQRPVDLTQLEADTYQLAVEAVQRRGFERVNDLLKAYDVALLRLSSYQSLCDRLFDFWATTEGVDLPRDLQRELTAARQRRATVDPLSTCLKCGEFMAFGHECE